jgi:hypothetical protein
MSDEKNPFDDMVNAAQKNGAGVEPVFGVAVIKRI